MPELNAPQVSYISTPLNILMTRDPTHIFPEISPPLSLHPFKNLVVSFFSPPVYLRSLTVLISSLPDLFFFRLRESSLGSRYFVSSTILFRVVLLFFFSLSAVSRLTGSFVIFPTRISPSHPSYVYTRSRNTISIYLGIFFH